MEEMAPVRRIFIAKAGIKSSELVALFRKINFSLHQNKKTLGVLFPFSF